MNKLFPIKNYEGLYSITKSGGVYSHRGKGKWLKLKCNKGYLSIILSNAGIKSKYVHRLVAETFIPNPENKPEVNHKNGDKSNNNDWNLEWATRVENCNHAEDNGLNKHPKTAKIYSKYIGVYWNKYEHYWTSCVNYNGVAHHLGRFNNEDDAYTKYLEEKIKIRNIGMIH